jgi:predicted aspartyl protease
MSLIGRSNRLFVLVSCVFCSAAIAAVPDQIEPTPQIVTVKIRLDERSMIIVPVSLNGSGPYDFMLDTGCAKTMVDRKLAGELGLPRVGEKTVVGALASARMSVVHVNSLSVGGATVLGGELFSTDHAATVISKVRGVLGEDFLRNFDVLIDYRHRVIRLESAPGSMAETAAGEHLPLQLTTTYHGKLTPNRLVISGRIQEFGGATMSLLLDSGTNQLTLFKDNLGPWEYEAEPIWTANFSSQWVASAAAAHRIRSLDLGSKSVSNLIVIAVSQGADVDSDGLIPTSLFHSIFISHLGRFVILNPSFPKTSRDAPAAPAAR